MIVDLSKLVHWWLVYLLFVHKMSKTIQDIDLEYVLAAESSQICNDGFFEKQVSNIAVFVFDMSFA